MGDMKWGRKGTSLAVSAIVLTAVVIVIGGGVWAFSQRATISSTEAYIQSTIEMVNIISERFIIEQVSHNGTHLKIWVYNYGEVDINVTVTYPDNSIGWIEILPNVLKEISFDFYKTKVEIRVESKRGNDEYYEFIP